MPDSTVSAFDVSKNPRCPLCGKEITMSIGINGGDMTPLCMPCVTKRLKAMRKKR